MSKKKEIEESTQSNNTEEYTDKINDSDSDISDENVEVNLDEQSISREIDNVQNENLPIELLEVKKNLLTVYLINLILYNKLNENEKEFSPIKEKLIKLSILIEKCCIMEEKIDDDIKEILDENETREAPKYIIENKGNSKKKRKREENNPRIKNKRKATELFEKSKMVVDKNIHAKKTKTNKFG